MTDKALNAVPKFFVYGEPARPLEIDFMHVETVMARRSLHAGDVAPHLHPQMAQITFWTSGGGEYSIEDSRWRFSAPTVSFVPSNVVHGFKVESGSDATVVSIANQALHVIGSRLDLSLDRPIIVVEGGDEVAWRRLAATMRQITAEFSDPLEGSQHALEALISIALINIARLQAMSVQPALPAMIELANRLERAIDQHFREGLLVGDYVGRLGTTPHLLDKAANEVLGASVKELIGQRQFLEAKRLLQFTVRPVEDICFELGFRDPAYFSRTFKKWAGQSPGAWRQARVHSAIQAPSVLPGE